MGRTAPRADAVIAAVSHSQYPVMPTDAILGKLKSGGVVMDVKSIFDPLAIRSAGYGLWRL